MDSVFPTRLDAINSLSQAGEHYTCSLHSINGNPCRVMDNAPLTLLSLLQHSQQFAELDYVVYGEERLSYAQTYAEVGRLAQALVDDYGIAKGDRVAIVMRNYPEWIIAFWAITSVGGIAVALNAHWTSEELNYALELTGSQLVFADRERVECLLPVTAPAGRSIIAVRCEACSGEGLRHYPDVVDKQLTEIPDVALDADDDAIIFFTSGSTGHPKGVVSSHRAVIHGIMSWDFDVAIVCHRFGLQRPDEPWNTRFKFLVATPLFHVAASHVSLIGALYRGREIHLMYKWDVMQALDIIEREQITHFPAVPSMTGDLVKAAKEHQRSLTSLSQVGGGGAPRPSKQVKEIDQVFTKAAPNTGWGMTETNAIGAGIAGRDYLAQPLSSGQSSAFLDLRILDDDDKELAAEETGHLVVRGTSMFREYWNRPDANAEAFVDGWFRTGDIARIDEEGFLFIVDRAKDIVIRGGENVGCGEVEDALYSHPAVNEVVVFGLPEERLGEEVCCMIHVEPGVALTEVEMREHVSGQLAAFQVPSRMFFSDEPLPRIASGKFNKRGVRLQLLQELGLSG